LETAIRQHLFDGITDKHCMLLCIHWLITPTPMFHETKFRTWNVSNILGKHPHRAPSGGSGRRRRDGPRLGPGDLKTESPCPRLSSLFVRLDVSDHFVLEHLPHGLLDLLEEDLRNPTAQGVDRVQELGLDGVEQRLEHVVLEGKLQDRESLSRVSSDPNAISI